MQLLVKNKRAIYLNTPSLLLIALTISSPFIWLNPMCSIWINAFHLARWEMEIFICLFDKPWSYFRVPSVSLAYVFSLLQMYSYSLLEMYSLNFWNSSNPFNSNICYVLDNSVPRCGWKQRVLEEKQSF